MGFYDFKNPVDPFTLTSPGDYDEKTVEVIVSGDMPGSNWVDVSLLKCIQTPGNTCAFVTDIGTGEGPGPIDCEFWSVPATWAGQFADGNGDPRVPIDGDYVTIPLGTCVIIDIGECEMPRLRFLEVNGLLKAKDDGPGTEPRALKSYNIWVRAGEL
jgi:hypothetical protein